MALYLFPQPAARLNAILSANAASAHTPAQPIFHLPNELFLAIIALIIGPSNAWIDERLDAGLPQHSAIRNLALASLRFPALVQLELGRTLLQAPYLHGCFADEKAGPEGKVGCKAYHLAM